MFVPWILGIEAEITLDKVAEQAKLLQAPTTSASGLILFDSYFSLETTDVLHHYCIELLSTSLDSLLTDDAEVSNDLWDEVIECLKLRLRDKVSIVRTFAVRALSHFVNDTENNDVLDLFLELLPLEQNEEVRKAIPLSFPPSNATSLSIINYTMDVSESVRKAAYCVLAEKCPL